MADAETDLDAGFEDQPLFLKELIEKVQEDLLASFEAREARGDPAIFEVADLTLEVNFVVERSGDLKGGVDFKVLTVGGSRQVSRQQVHKVTLKLVGVPFGAPEDGAVAYHDDSLPTFRPSED